MSQSDSRSLPLHMVRSRESGAYTRLGFGLWFTVSAAQGCTCNQASEYNFPIPPDDPSVVEPPTSIGSWLSLDTAPDGIRLTMSYYDKDMGGVAWAVGVPHEDGTVSWTHERVAGYPDSNGLDLADVGLYTSQKTAPDGTVWLAYHNPRTGALNVAHRTGPGAWEVTESVDGGSAAPGVGHWASLAMDTQGHPVVAHCDMASTAVRVSRFDGQAWSTTQAYRSLPVDTTDPEGVVTTIPAGVAHTKIIVSPTNEYLAFYDSAQGALHVMHGQGGTFEDEVVDDNGNVGAWPSMVATDDELWVAYHDVGNDRLKFASSNGSEWQTLTVDNGEMRGADTALFNKEGSPAIVYSDSYNNDQWLAARGASGAASDWTLEKLGGDEGPIGFHNEVSYAAGRWWSASYNYASNGLFLKGF